MNIYIQNLPPPVDDKVLKLIMCAYGEIENATVIRDHNTNESKCYGFVQFRTVGAAEKAITTLNGNDIAGPPLVVRIAIPLHARQNHVNLYIRNLSRNFDSQDLYDLFSPFGEISSHTILNDDTGQSRGIGFVRFTSLEAAEKAIKLLSGTKPNKDFVQNIHVELADKNDPTIIDKASPASRPSKGSRASLLTSLVPLALQSPTLSTASSSLNSIQSLSPIQSISSLQPLSPSSPCSGIGPAAGTSGTGASNEIVSPSFEFKAREYDIESHLLAPQPQSEIISPLTPTALPDNNNIIMNGSGLSMELIMPSRSPVQPLQSLQSLQTLQTLQSLQSLQSLQPTPLSAPMPTNPDIDLCNVYIHGFPKCWDDSDLINKFMHYGTIVSVRVMRTKNGESRGIGFVRFETTEEAQTAIALVAGSEVDGKSLTCRIANTKAVNSMLLPLGIELQPPLAACIQSPGGSQGIDPTNVYVHGFPKNWEDSDLIEKFSRYGIIVSTRVMRDKTTGESRSIGFVKFSIPDEAARAIKEVHSTMEDGKVLVCRIANAGSIGKSPCKYYKEGRCNKGSNCTFSHDISVMHNPATLVLPSPTLLRSSTLTNDQSNYLLKDSDQLSYIFRQQSPSSSLSTPHSAVSSIPSLPRSNAASNCSPRIVGSGLVGSGLVGPTFGHRLATTSSSSSSCPSVFPEVPTTRAHLLHQQQQHHQLQQQQQQRDFRDTYDYDRYMATETNLLRDNSDYDKLVDDFDDKHSAFDLEPGAGKCTNSPYHFDSIKQALKVYPISVSDGERVW